MLKYLIYVYTRPSARLRNSVTSVFKFRNHVCSSYNSHLYSPKLVDSHVCVLSFKLLLFILHRLSLHHNAISRLTHLSRSWTSDLSKCLPIEPQRPLPTNTIVLHTTRQTPTIHFPQSISILPSSPGKAWTCLETTLLGSFHNPYPAGSLQLPSVPAHIHIQTQAPTAVVPPSPDSEGNGRIQNIWWHLPPPIRTEIIILKYLRQSQTLGIKTVTTDQLRLPCPSHGPDNRAPSTASTHCSHRSRGHWILPLSLPL